MHHENEKVTSITGPGTFTGDFAGGKDFDGNRWNACHYTVAAKRAARDAAKGAKDD